MPQHHIIKQQIVDIQCDDKQLAQDLFRETGRLFNNRVSDVTAEVFDKLIDERQIIHLDRLEVNMNVVPFPYSEEEFVQNYKRALEEELLKYLKKLETTNYLVDEETGTQSISELSHKRLLEHYLVHGVIPWWAANAEVKSPAQIFNQFLKEDERQLKELVLRLLPKKQVRKRFAYHFEEEQIKTVIHLIEPGESAFINRYHLQVSQSQQEQRFLNAEATEFRKTVWLFILDFLALQTGSRFNRKMFVKTTLSDIAAHYNISFEKILFYFFEAAKVLPAPVLKEHQLIEIIREISSDLNTDLPDEINYLISTNTRSTLRKEESTLNQALYFLVYGHFKAGKVSVKKENLGPAFIEGAEKQPSRILKTAYKHGKEQGFRTRLIRDFGEASVKKMIQLTEPSGSDVIIDYADFTMQVYQKKNLVSSSQQEFRFSLWEFILAFLFSERGSVFNTRMFLENNIRSLARHYNLHFKTALALLVQAVGEENTKAGENSGLFFNLLEILKKENTRTSESADSTLLLNATGKLASKNLLGKSEQFNYRKHLLLYWFRYSDVPWWARETNTDISVLLEDLIDNSPNDAVIIFKLALLQNKVSPDFYLRHNLLAQKLIALLPGGKTASEQLWQLINNSAKLKTLFNENTLHGFISGVLSRTYLQTNFTTIELNKAFQLLLGEIEQRTGKETFQSVIKEVKANKLTKQLSELKTVLKTIDENSLLLDSLPQQNYSYSLHFTEQFLTDLRREGSFKSTSNESLAQDILNYFITHHELPDFILSNPLPDKVLFIRSLIIFLTIKNIALLKQLFDNKQHSVANRIEVYSLLPVELLHSHNNLKELVLTHFKLDVLELLENTDLQAHVDALRIEELLKKIEGQHSSSQRIAILKTILKAPLLQVYASGFYNGTSFIGVMRDLAGDTITEQARSFLYIFGLIAPDSFEREKLSKYVREFFFYKFSSAQNRTFSDSALLQEFIHFLYYNKQLSLSLLHFRLRKLLESSSGQDKTVIRLLENTFEAMSYFVSNEQLKQELEKELEEEEDEEEEEELEEDPEEEEELAEGEHVYINNAGLVILHPFISHLFTRTGLTEKLSFAGDDKQTKGIYLLQYAASGNENAEEHELILNKLLCGMDPQDVAIISANITDEDKAVANQMLEAVIQQWDKLKNTSVEGLRGSFLMRPGYLMNTDEAWVLRVEQRGYDLLLQTLPWSFGMVKFSWMKKPIIVEWT